MQTSSYERKLHLSESSTFIRLLVYSGSETIIVSTLHERNRHRNRERANWNGTCEENERVSRIARKVLVFPAVWAAVRFPAKVLGKDRKFHQRLVIKLDSFVNTFKTQQEITINLSFNFFLTAICKFNNIKYIAI